MDDMVRAAMAKWPQVPDCRGWLALDARGDWYMRDAATQARGPFPQSKGSCIRHEALKAFIQRNYQADSQGRWYFQNGPQRVWVELEDTPLIWRLWRETGAQDWQVTAHTGAPAVGEISAWVDEAGRLYLSVHHGAIGRVHSQDMVLAAQALEEGRWPLQEVLASDLPARFGFVRQP